MKSEIKWYYNWALLAVVVLIFNDGIRLPQKIQRVHGYAEGTTYDISWWTTQPISRGKLIWQISRILNQIDKEFSTYRSDSYISQFNQSRSTDWQKASADFISLLRIAKRINHQTKGCYDPTIKKLSSLWGFQEGILHVPSIAQITAVKTETGLDKIHISPDSRYIRKTVPGIQLDFSSMGEGYTIGKLSRVMESDGVTNYLIEFGGDMKIRGHKPKGKKWRVAIERPVANTKDLIPYKIVTIDDQKGITLNSSGTYRHSFHKNGKEYSHILDPRTGMPVTHGLVSALVFGHDPQASDAWATAMMCLGVTQGKRVADQQHLGVFFIHSSQSNKLVDLKSNNLSISDRVTFDKKMILHQR